MGRVLREPLATITHGDDVWSVVWSDDGRSLLTTAADQEVRVTPVLSSDHALATRARWQRSCPPTEDIQRSTRFDAVRAEAARRECERRLP